MIHAKSLHPKATLIAISLLATTLGYAQSPEANEPAPQGTEPTPVQEENPAAETPRETPAAQAPTSNATQQKSTERVTVTGSRIKRTESETSAPVGVVTKEQIQKSGTVSLGEFFQKAATASPTGNFTGQSGFVSAGSSTIDLLGLGADRTLILVNGKRLPTMPGLGAVNIETIPTALVEKIEILTGGASAVYGADAVGGVVNIVTRKDMVGTEAAVQINVPMRAGGEEKSLTVAQGVQVNDDLNIAITGGYRQRNAIDQRNRDLAYSFPERANTVSNGPAGTYSYAPLTYNPATGGASFGAWQPSANCPAPNQIATVPEEPQNVYCTGPRADVPVELISDREEWHAASTFDYMLNDKWTLSGLLSYTNGITTSNAGAARYATDPFYQQALLLSAARATELGVPVPAGATHVQIYGPTTEAKDAIYENNDSAFVSGLYLNGDIGNWATSFGLSYASSGVVRKGKNLINRQARQDIFSNPNTALGEDPIFVPIDPNRDISLLSSTTGSLESKEWADTVSIDAFASKDLFELPGGNFTLGFGASVTSERFKQTPDKLDLLKASNNAPLYVGTFANGGKGDRTIASLYTEVFAPVHSMVDVDAALRFDSYSDVDAGLNYGVGTKIKFVPDVMAFRARAASSYKAPPLAYVHQKGGGGYFNVDDQYDCARENANGGSCDPSAPSRQVYVDFPGNKDLDPEVGVNYNIGLIIDPAPGFAITSDYYWVFLEDTFQVDDFQTVVDRWYAANGTGSTGGKQGDNTVQVDADGIITQLGTPYRNLGRTHVRLWQTKANYQQNFGTLVTGFESEYNRMHSFKVQEATGLPTRQLKGMYGIPEWRWNNTVDVGVRNHMVRLAARTTGPQYPDPVNSNDWVKTTTVGVHTEYDTVYSSELPWDASLSLGVNNIFNKIGGVIPASAVGYEEIASSSLYSYVGRSYFARYSQRF